MKVNRGKRAKYLVRVAMGLVDDNDWEGPLGDYPDDLFRVIRKRLLKEVRGLAEKFNTRSRYFGYRIKANKDRVYIYVQKKRLLIDLDIPRSFEVELQKEGFEVHFRNNFQGRAGWLTGWRLPHTTKNIETVMKWLLKALDEGG